MWKFTTASIVFALLAPQFGGGCSGRNSLGNSLLSDTLAQSLGMTEPPARPIQRIVPIWKAAKGQDMQGRPCRGAAGQILFFAAGSDKAVKLEGDGEVVVYVFDDLGTPEENRKPIHKFKFDIPSWNRHLHVDSQLGPGYHVFIPYTRNVVTAAQMSLNVRLIPKRGMPASSEMVVVSLPGPNPTAGTKMQVVSRPSRKKTNVSTFQPDQYLNGSKNRAAVTNAAGKSPRSSAQFHDFDLTPKTQVRSLGPVRQVAPGEKTTLDEIRERQNEQLRKVLAGFPKRPPAQRANGVDVNDRRETPTRSRSFQLASATRGSQDHRVVTAGHEQVVPDQPRDNVAVRSANGRGGVAARKATMLLDGPAELGPRRDRNVQHSLHTTPANGNPFETRGPGTATRNPLAADAGTELGTKKATPRTARPNHPLVDERGAWGDN